MATTAKTEHVWTKLYSQIPTNKPLKLQIEDHVRVLKQRSTFGKGNLSAWSEEIYIVANVIDDAPVVYKIKDLFGEF